MPTERKPRRPMSLALRITTFVGLTMTAMFVLFTVQILYSIEDHFTEQDLGELEAVSSSIRKAIGNSATLEDERILDGRLARAVAGHHGVYFSVRDSRGVAHYGTAPADLVDAAATTPSTDRLTEPSLRQWSTHYGTYRGVVLQIQDARVLVALGIDFHLRYLARLQQVLWGGTVVVCLLSVLAAWLAARWGHAPMRRLSNQVRGITSEQLHLRLDPAEVPSELTYLVTSFNLMLDRLQSSFERLSHFSVDIAHELRTPVTNLTTQMQVALSRPRAIGAYQEVLYSNLEELDRMSKMIGDMLYLAQAEHPTAEADKADVDLAAEVRELFEYFEALAEELEVPLELHGQAPAVLGDRLMLRRLFSNLISNGLRYVPRGQPLTVRLARVDQNVRVTVENAGPEIPAEHLPKLFDRFYRADPSRQRRGEGAGLGLAIVKSIVDAHGGTVTVRSDNGRTRFTVTLPMAQGHRLSSGQQVPLQTT